MKKLDLERKIKNEENTNNIKHNKSNLNLKNIVIVENYPSAREILNILDNYLDQINYSKNYNYELKDNIMRFTFNNSVNLY
jgi:hypothetical protein